MNSSTFHYLLDRAFSEANGLFRWPYAGLKRGLTEVILGFWLDCLDD